MFKSNFIFRFLGLSELSKKERGLAYILLVTFVPLVYKIIVPFFVVAGLNEFTIIINPIIMIIGLIMAKNRFWGNIKPLNVFLFLVFAICLYLWQFLRPETQRFYDENYLRFIFQVAIFFFVGLSVTGENLDKILSFVARTGLLVQLFWQMCYLLGLVVKEDSFDGTLGEQMEFAYQLLFPICIFVLDFSKTKNLVNALFLITSILLLLFMGTRGPIIVCAVYIMGYFIFINRFNSHNRLKKTFVVVLFGLFYYFVVPICELIAPFAASLGFSTRVFDSVIENSMINMEASSNRDDFYGSVYRAIIDGHGSGYGWGGDRLKTPTGGYAHNFELEILCQYGLIVGGIILTILFIYIIHTFLKCRTQDEKSLVLVMLSVGLLSLQFSNSYVSSPMFFVMLGSFLALNRQRKQTSLLRNDYKMNYNKYSYTI